MTDEQRREEAERQLQQNFRWAVRESNYDANTNSLWIADSIKQEKIGIEIPV